MVVVPQDAGKKVLDVDKEIKNVLTLWTRHLPVLFDYIPGLAAFKNMT